MKVLVAGRGFIGEAIGKRLEGKHDVKYLDRSEADFVQDVTEGFSLEEEFDVLIHTIGLAPGFSTPREYREVHVEGTRNLLEGVKADKVVFLSALKAGEVNHSFFRTKREAEKMVENSEKQHVIVRPSTVYGEGNKLLEMMKKLGFTRVFPDISTRTQPIMIQDLAEIVEKLLEKEGIFRIAGPDKITLGELARQVYREEGYNCFLVPYPQFLLEMKLSLLAFLPPPFQKENIRILRHENTTDENDAEELIELQKVV
ncbi:MAG: NAD-dependent epimerase/dehydratase family protein [Candidatus Aenigmatarchaeota archaeon]